MHDRMAALCVYASVSPSVKHQSLDHWQIIGKSSLFWGLSLSHMLSVAVTVLCLAPTIRSTQTAGASWG